MGLSTSKSKTKTTPTVAPWMDQNLKDFSGKINDFLGTDPSQYVAGADPLQTQSAAGAANLGGWQAGLTAAQQAAAAAGAAPAAQAGVTNASASTYSAPQLGNAAQAGAVNIAPVTNASATMAGTHSILDNGGVQKYVDPAIQNYVDTTLAQYDNQTGQDRAAMAAKAAGSGAFGGSRYGIAQGQFEADSNRNRALTDAQLRAQAYAQALAAAGGDADRATQTDVANAGMQTGVSQFNAGSANSRSTNQAGLDQSRNLANTDAINQFRIAQGGFDSQAGQFNAGAANQNSMFNAGAANTNSMFNASQEEAAQARALQAAQVQAGIANSQASNATSDVMTQAQIGEMQRAIEQAQLNAVPTQLQIGGALYGAINPGAYIGQNSTTKSSPGIGNVVGGLAGAGLAGWASGGFKF